MSLIANIKNALFQRRLLREIESRKPDYQSRPVHPDRANCVALLFPADTVEERKVVEAYREARKKQGLRTELLGYFTTDVGESHFGFDHFSVKDVNWYGVPKGSSVEKFLSRSCDILITLGPAGHQQLDYLAALKKADLRVGPHTEHPENPNDVQFATKQAQAGFAAQLQQIESIFKVTNAAASTATV